MKENEEALCRLDSNIGDGDHGIGMAKIGNLIEEGCEQVGENCPGKLTEEIGDLISSRVGGSSGMLWGTFFEGMSLDSEERDEMEKDYFLRMFTSGFEELLDVSGAGEGDKTMLDAVIPAYRVLKDAEGTEAEIFGRAADAAEEGAEKTAGYIAKFGRAKNLKERAIGHRDAGAVSAAMMIRKWADALADE